MAGDSAGMAAGSGPLSPGEAARQVGIAVSTLRVYSVKLADALSESAGRPKLAPGGRPGVRAYSTEDVRLLNRAKELLGRGLTYQQVAEALGPKVDRNRGSEGGGRSRRARGETVSEVVGMLEALRGTLETAGAAAEGWRRLAEEREKEVNVLRARVDALEQEIRRARRSWWRRLSGSAEEGT